MQRGNGSTKLAPLLNYLVLITPELAEYFPPTLTFVSIRYKYIETKDAHAQITFHEIHLYVNKYALISNSWVTAAPKRWKVLFKIGNADIKEQKVMFF